MRTDDCAKNVWTSFSLCSALLVEKFSTKRAGLKIERMSFYTWWRKLFRESGKRVREEVMYLVVLVFWLLPYRPDEKFWVEICDAATLWPKNVFMRSIFLQNTSHMSQLSTQQLCFDQIFVKTFILHFCSIFSDPQLVLIQTLLLAVNLVLKNQ